MSKFCVDSGVGGGYNRTVARAVFINRRKEGMMKNAFVSTILGIMLFALVFWLNGCGESFAQLGETAAEGHRRHQRNLAINRQEMMGDIDRVLLLDKPSKLTDKRIN